MSSYIQKNYVEGKVVVITGASSGFGKLLAQKVAGMGGISVMGARNEEALAATAQEITAAGGRCAWLKTDVSKKEDVDALIAMAVKEYGRVDVLVNNAGAMPLAFYADHEKAMDKWVTCIDTNLKGTLFGICAVYDQMMAQGEGQIINIASIYANYPVAGSAVYQATKIGVEYLSESLRQETQGKIRVSCVKPTGVPATGLGGSVVNPQAAMSMMGMKAGEYISMSKELGQRPELSDRESISYLNCDPEVMVDNIVYLINQPKGINISDITVRSSNERYML